MDQHTIFPLVIVAQACGKTCERHNDKCVQKEKLCVILNSRSRKCNPSNLEKLKRVITKEQKSVPPETCHDSISSFQERKRKNIK